MQRRVLLLALVVLLCAGQRAARADLLTNGSFEDGDFTGWIGGPANSHVTSGAFYPYSGPEDGIYYAILGPVGGDATLSQSFFTAPGADYTFSFYLNAAGDSPSDFSAYWNAIELVALTNPDTGSSWTLYSFGVTGTGSDSITLSFRDDPGWIALDNVSVAESAGAVPEPGSLLLLGSGLLAMLGALRRVRR